MNEKQIRRYALRRGISLQKAIRRLKRQGKL